MPTQVVLLFQCSLKKITIELKSHLIDVFIQIVDHNSSAIKVQFNLNADTVICSKV